MNDDGLHCGKKPVGPEPMDTTIDTTLPDTTGVEGKLGYTTSKDVKPKLEYASPNTSKINPNVLSMLSEFEKPEEETKVISEEMQRNMEESLEKAIQYDILGARIKVGKALNDITDGKYNLDVKGVMPFRSEEIAGECMPITEERVKRFGERKGYGSEPAGNVTYQVNLETGQVTIEQANPQPVEQTMWKGFKRTKFRAPEEKTQRVFDVLNKELMQTYPGSVEKIIELHKRGY